MSVRQEELGERIFIRTISYKHSRGTNDYGHMIASRIVCVQCAFCARSCSCFRSLAPTSERSPRQWVKRKFSWRNPTAKGIQLRKGCSRSVCTQRWVKVPALARVRERRTSAHSDKQERPRAGRESTWTETEAETETETQARWASKVSEQSESSRQDSRHSTRRARERANREWEATLAVKGKRVETTWAENG